MNRIAAGLMAGLFLFTQPAWAAPLHPAANPATPGTVEATLANGMRVVLLVNRLAPVATTVMTYGVGSDDDTMPGIAHATEHMMFRGTADVSSTQFAEIAARAGAEYDAETQKLWTEYYFKIPSAYVGLALRLEADRMNGALIRQSDWQSERPAIEQEVRAHQSVPGAALGTKLLTAFFGDVPYAHDGVGTIESFNKMTAADIREFYRRWYHPNNATLVVAGDIDPAEVLAEIRRDFDSIPSATLPAHTAYTIKPLVATTISDSIAEFPVPVGSSVYRFPAFDSPDFGTALVVAQALSDPRSAIGDLEAQGKVLAAFASAGGFRDVGVLSVAGAGLPGSSPVSIRTAIDGALDDYRDHGIPAALIDAARRRLLSTREYRAASISGLAFAWAAALASGRSSPDEGYADIAKVTPADAQRLLQQYITPQDELGVLVTPKPGAAAVDDKTPDTSENVQVTPDKEEPLPPWAAAYFQAPLTVPQFDQRTVTYHLKNGITLTVRPEHFSPTVVVRGEIHMSPHLYEPRGKDGVASLTESLLPWGTTTYDRLAYQAQLDAIAAQIDLGASFGLTVESKNFARGVQLLADGELHPAFPQTAFTLLQRNEARTLAAVEHEPQTQADIAETNALYPPGDPRRRRATQKTVGNVRLSDVRKWHKIAYRPDETTIAIVGDVSPEQARAAVVRYFGNWHAVGKPPSFAYPRLKAAKKQSVTVTSSTSTHAEVTLTQVIGVHSGDRDVAALELANTMLSDEGTGSLLFRDLRTTRGYVYSVDSNLDIEPNTSTFAVNFASDSKNVAAAQAAAISEIRRLQQEPVPSIELQRAKALLLAERVLPLDSYGGIADDILESARDGLSVAQEDRFWLKLLDVTPMQVREAMRRWIHVTHFSRVVVAPGA